jgi:ACS family sodium-dependent inorganic phosphate cotransporter
LTITFFTIAMTLMGAYYSGMKINALDLSPNYSGATMAITNGIAAVSGIVSPILIGQIATNVIFRVFRIIDSISHIVKF